jgi:penicillin-binding protein 1B
MSPVCRTFSLMSTGRKKTKGKKKTVRRKTARKKATAKKTSNRQKRSGKITGLGWVGRIWRLVMLATGIGLGLLLPWTAYLNHQVTTEFEGRKWDLPSRVYARPLELYPGLPLSLKDIELELSIAGYRRVSTAGRPGQYSLSGGTVKIFRRSFRFYDGDEDALRFSVSLLSGNVSKLRELESGHSLELVRLEPAEIAAIYPLQKEDRTLVRIKDVPPLLLTGLQAVEDRNFKHHPGVDIKGIARAALANLRAGRAVQGGSTLTQQLVKNYFLSDERTILRKINEAIMALLLEFHYEKAEILEAYLNEVFLGQQGAYAVHGFGRASLYYFDQPLDRLAPQHIALLIGMVRGASYYNPRRHPERALNRRNQVLSAFETTGLLSSADARSAKTSSLDVTEKARSRGTRYHAFVDLVRRQLALVYREDDLKTEGLNIFTTISPSDQEKAQKAVSDGLRGLQDRGLSASLQAAMVLADSDSGEVRALVGDRDASRAGFNRALDARRQIGSVIKPLVYLLALEHEADYNLLTRIEDQPISLKQPGGKSWSPANYDKVSHGDVTLLEALTRSYNQATVRLGLNIGISHLINKLEQLGVRADIQAVPSIFLGAVELTPLEVTQIYQSFAVGGYSVPLRAVIAVQTADGSELVRYPLRMMPLSRRDAIGVLNYAMTQVVEQGTAKALPGLLGKQTVIAGKTGTTNDRRDSWFVGYTRNRIAVAWVGEDDNRPARVTGSNAAMRLWAGLFRELPIESLDLRLPDGASWLWVDRDNGRLTAQGCPGAMQVPFVDGSGPGELTDCLARTPEDEKESFWRKWFGKKN